MSSYSLKIRNMASTWLSLLFFLTLIMYLGYIEFFQDSKIEFESKNLLSSPIEKEFLDNVQKINFKNRIGNFSVKSENGSWYLYSPRNLPAKTITVSMILNELKKLKIKTVHEYEKINIKSFSLDKPTIEMDLEDDKNKKINLKLGIINRIDDTTYIALTGQKIIYQIKMFNNPLESIELSDFIDSRVFSVSKNDIAKISIFSGKNVKARNILEYKNNKWFSKNYSVISNARTFNKIESILSINTHMIIDKSNRELNTFIQNYLSNPLYRIQIKTNSGKNLIYKISSLTKAIKEHKIEKRQYFLMSASDRPFPFLIHKSFLERFQLRYSDIRN